ncbi:hypothetical protein ACFY9N_09935 [Microbacterium sp. NPDC008134]|uniref:hypothetical protein n=1 Tax=Microbacterium sp. NPDC008134 TaxID=3364183 RepID=UPI0036E22FF8
MLTAAFMLLLSACESAENSVEDSEKTENPVTASQVSLEEAKAQAQAMELEIAGLVPSEVVVSVDQMPKGTLFSCSDVEWTWYGATTVTVLEGTDIEAIVRSIQAHYEGSRFDLRTRRDIADDFEVQLMSPKTAETYIVGEGFTPTEIRIDSGSVCFTLPEGTWTRGSF